MGQNVGVRTEHDGAAASRYESPMLVCIHLALVAYNGIFCGNLMLHLVLHEVEAGRMHGDEGGIN